MLKVIYCVLYRANNEVKNFKKEITTEAEDSKIEFDFKVAERTLESYGIKFEKIISTSKTVINL